MGLFNSDKFLGDVVITFKDQGRASILYRSAEVDIRRQTFDLLEMFLFYYSKILFNCSDKREITETLSSYINQVIETLVENEETLNVLPSDLLLVTNVEREEKIYKISFFEKKDGTRYLKLKNSFGGEGHYGPCSLMIFLQHLLNNLEESPKQFLIASLVGMQNFYQLYASHGDIRALVIAPNFGMNAASDAIKDL